MILYQGVKTIHSVKRGMRGNKRENEKNLLFKKKKEVEMWLHFYLFFTFCFTEQICLGPDCVSLCHDVWQDAVNIPDYPDVTFEKLKSVIHLLWNKKNDDRNKGFIESLFPCPKPGVYNVRAELGLGY